MKTTSVRKSSIFTSKRADSIFDIGWETAMLVLLVIVFLLFFFVIRWFANISLDVTEAKGAILINRIYYTSGGINYHDGIRYYPGIIDPARFSSRSLSEAINFTKKIDIAAKITLLRADYEPFTDPIYLNEEWYRRWDVLTTFKGKGSSERVKETRYVLIWDAYYGQYTPGFLDIDVVMPSD